MAEKFPTIHEKHSTPIESDKRRETFKPTQEKHATAEKHAISKEKIYQTVEKHAISKEASHTSKPEKAHHERPHHYITRKVKRGIYMHTIKNVQADLKPAERQFSKIIHNPTVEAISELGSNTVGRPNAILGGGIIMVFGGLALLIMARYFGFTIPMSSLIALYIIGFILLLVVELLAKPFFYHRQRKRNK